MDVHGSVMGPVPFSIFTNSLERGLCPLVRFAEATKPGENGKHWKTFLKKNKVQDNITEVVLKP